MAPKCSSSGWSVRMILRHKVVGIGSGRAAGVSCTEVFGGNWLHPCLHKLQLLLKIIARSTVFALASTRIRRLLRH